MGLIKFRSEQAALVPEVYRALDPDALYDGKNKANMFMTSFLQRWIEERTPIRAVKVAGGWLEVDTSEELELYARLHAEGKLAGFVRI
jgi:NDP-sugar pyrophosphorylase family protein